MRLIPILTALVVLAGMYVFIFQQQLIFGSPLDVETAETTEDALQSVAVVALRSEAQPVQSGLVLRGRTEAHRKVEVRAETSGVVISEPQTRGSEVAAGELLCELDPGTRQASLTQARAQLQEARLNAQAARTLSERGFSSATEVAARQAQLEGAQAGVEQAETELGRLQITAPFAGLLETDTAELGSLLQPGSLCAELVDLSKVRFVGFVPEADIHRVALGAPAGARLISGAEVVGQISFISRSADALTKTFRVEFEVDNTLNLPDGATAEIGIALAGEVAHLVPQAALTLDDQGRLGVRIVEEGLAQFRAVTVVRDQADGLWLTGLPEQADIIVTGQEFVGDGSPVTVTLAEGAS